MNTEQTNLWHQEEDLKITGKLTSYIYKQDKLFSCSTQHEIYPAEAILKTLFAVTQQAPDQLTQNAIYLK